MCANILHYQQWDEMKWNEMKRKSPSDLWNQTQNTIVHFALGNNVFSAAMGSDFQAVRLKYSQPDITYQLLGHSFLIKWDTKRSTNNLEKKIHL